ncbi:MAG: Hsp20 family protein [Janthinobacterium lividum]
MAYLAPRSVFDDLFTDFASGFFIKPVRAQQAEKTVNFGIRTEVREDDNAYTIAAELPGVAKEDIHVSIEGKVVTITAEVKRDESAVKQAAPTTETAQAGAGADAVVPATASTEVTKPGRVLHSERVYGQARRAFSFPAEVDSASARAKHENGVLTLTLPKQRVAAAHQLTVE